MLELAQQLSAHLAPDLDPSQAAAYVVKEIKADTHGGSRKEWHEVVASIEGSAGVLQSHTVHLLMELE